MCQNSKNDWGGKGLSYSVALCQWDGANETACGALLQAGGCLCRLVSTCAQIVDNETLSCHLAIVSKLNLKQNWRPTVSNWSLADAGGEY